MTDAPRSDKPAAPRRYSNEIKYHGEAACRALWKHRPHDIVRLYVQESRVGDFGELLKWAARARKAYHLVGPADLEKLTETVHHQGICILAKEAPRRSFDDLRPELEKRLGASLLIYLDGVENPHNLGAILRSCAHFGVHHVLGRKGQLQKLSPSAIRIAEGGTEVVELIDVANPKRDLALLKKMGYTLLATAVGGRSTSLYEYNFPERCVLVLGAEVQGTSTEMLESADRVLRIPGTGLVDSLNVSVACGVLTGEFYRQRVAARK